MRLFGYIDDFLVRVYNWLDFIPSALLHKIVFVAILWLIFELGMLLAGGRE